MPTVLTKTVKSTGGDYTSLSAAEAGEQGDLVSLDRQLDIACYAMTDTTQVTISGWTMDATRYLRVVAPVGQRHAGVWDGSKYNLTLSTSGSPGGCITVREDKTRLEYLQVRNTKVSPGQFDCAIYGDVETYRADGCIARDGYNGIHMSVVGSEMRNSIAYGCSNAGGSITSSGGIVSLAYNCTLVGAVYGLDTSSSGVYSVAKNIYGHGGTQGIRTSSGGAAKTNCMTSDTTATDNSGGGGATNCTNSVAHSTANFTNVTGGSENYHLVVGSALIDAGVDLSGTFTNDIDGDTRSAPFDVGADEYVAAGGGGLPGLGNYYRQLCAA